MSKVGTYLYGFTAGAFQPAPELCGLAGMPVRLLCCRDLAAVVSAHPVQRLLPSRRLLEPHHRVVRQISAETTLVPAAFGHITGTEDEIFDVLEAHYDEIREALARLDGTCEMSVKLRWSVENIFEHLVRVNRDLRELRDRVFRNRQPPMNEKLQVGAMFETTLARERERLATVLLDAFTGIACDTVSNPVHDERIACHAALLVPRARADTFGHVVRDAAARFNGDFTLEYGGPWPPYSFVRLRLEPATRTTVA